MDYCCHLQDVLTCCCSLIAHLLSFLVCYFNCDMSTEHTGLYDMHISFKNPKNHFIYCDISLDHFSSIVHCDKYVMCLWHIKMLGVLDSFVFGDVLSCSRLYWSDKKAIKTRSEFVIIALIQQIVIRAVNWSL